MRGMVTAVLGGAVLVLAVGQEAGAQEDAALRRKIDAQLAELAASSRDAFRGLVFYPKEVRHACLEISRYPSLVVKLNDAIGRGGFEPDKVLIAYPPGVRAAARVLAGWPEVLPVLEEDLLMTGVVGRVYEADPEGVLRLVDVMCAHAERAAARSTDAWVDALVHDALALDELRQASEDYARSRQRSTTTTVTISADISHGYGFSIESSSDVTVYYTPSYMETRFVLYNADRYPHLADEIVYHYHRFADDCLDDFRRAYHEWYDHRARYYPDDFFHVAGRAERLKQAASYERRLSGAYKGRALSFAERNSFLQRHAVEYPLLRVFRDPATARGPRYAPSMDAPRRTPREVAVRRPTDRRATREPVRGSRETDKGKRRVSKGDTERGTGAAEARRPSVKRGQPSEAQRVRRAGRAHRSAWDRGGAKGKSRAKDGGH